MEILARKGYRSVAELSEDLDVSEMTIRRYLTKLEQRNLIKRTHGGAFTGQEMIEVDCRVRETICRAEKETIGLKAYSLIQPGESVFIDAGSTIAFLAFVMDDTKRITVVTHSIVVAQTLERKTNIETILLGGKVHGATHSVVGPLAEKGVTQFRFTKAFIGDSGIDISEGLTQSTFDEIPVKKLVSENTKEVVVLVDSTKFNKSRLVLFLSLDQVHTIITDTGIKSAYKVALEEQGIQVIVADEESKTGS